MIRWFRGWVTGQKDPDALMPKAYGPGARELHDDWLPGFRWIPRRWTFYPLPMPAFKFAGTMEPDFIEVQEGYPMVEGAMLHRGYRTQPDGKFVYSEQGTLHIYAYHPGQDGTWVVLGPYIPALGRRLPSFFALSFLMPRLPLIGKRRFNFSAGLFKPDVTLGDNGWWAFELSLTLIEIK